MSNNINSNRKDKNIVLQTLIEEVSETETYIGKSEVGRKKDENVWQIMKVVEYGSNTTISYADNNDDFIHNWELRSVYNYNIK